MNDIDKNKEICRRLALHWHEGIICSCGVDLLMWPGKYPNPDFIRHPEELLRVLVKWEGWGGFRLTICGAKRGNFDVESIRIEYVLNQTGKLADAFLEFTEGK
jgi:hypothetical protein